MPPPVCAFLGKRILTLKSLCPGLGLACIRKKLEECFAPWRCFVDGLLVRADVGDLGVGRRRFCKRGSEEEAYEYLRAAKSGSGASAGHALSSPNDTVTPASDISQPGTGERGSSSTHAARCGCLFCSWGLGPTIPAARFGLAHSLSAYANKIIYATRKPIGPREPFPTRPQPSHSWDRVPQLSAGRLSLACYCPLLGRQCRVVRSKWSLSDPI